MNARRKCVIRWSALAVLGGVSLYVVALMGDPTDLDGKFSSYELFPHDALDVVEFSNGMVTSKT
ncbi:MAG: hypothetical protein AAF585_26155, partial [Verrucomicrobiota bacterium]